MVKGGGYKSGSYKPGKGGLTRNETRKFLDSHPASQTIMPRNVDRSMFGHGDAQGLRSAGGNIATHTEVSEQLLSGSAANRSTDVLAWMDELKADSSSFIDSRYDELLQNETRSRLNRSAISFIVDQLFQDLTWFAAEFNKIARSTSMQITSTILGEVTEVLQSNRNREAECSATFFRARLSNRHYALVIKGGENIIQFFLMPTSQMMAQSVVEREYSPAAEIEIKVVGNAVSWRLRGAKPAPETMDELSMYLFGLLIEATKQEVRRNGNNAD